MYPLILNNIIDKIYLFNFLFFIIMFSFIYYFFTQSHEYNIFSQNKTNNFDKMTRFTDYLYYSIITQSTIGYGDITPNSYKVRFISALQALSTILLISI